MAEAGERVATKLVLVMGQMLKQASEKAAAGAFCFCSCWDFIECIR